MKTLVHKAKAVPTAKVAAPAPATHTAGSSVPDAKSRISPATHSAGSSVPHSVRTLEFFVNYACNAKCPFCFNPPDASPALEKGLPFRALADRMMEGRAKGYGGIKFIGGEATIREDFPKVVGLARKLGFKPIQLTTNGIRLAEKAYARSLVRQGVDHVRFSIHGHTPALHDRLVAVPGALDKVRRAVAHMREAGIPMGINYVLNRVNAAAAPETLSWFHSELGISDVIVYFLRFQGFGALPQNKALLKMPMSEAAPCIQEAFRRLRAEGRSPLPAVIHMPPCVVPELEADLLDWTTDPEACGEGNTRFDLVTLPDGSGGRIHEVTNAGKRPVAACASCKHGGKCLGVESDYLGEYGDAEFQPLKGE